jgi:two-component system, OmpR family, phosphate regulon sensor histidine kinase PhoR
MPSKDEQIESLIESNDELENYFRNTIIPQLFIDSDLVLRKFTPPAMRQFNLQKGDVGKSINDIKDNFRYECIIEDIQCVIDNNEILEKDIQTTDKRWYQMNVIPYVEIKTKKTNGVIITFVETTMRITDLKEQEDLLTEHERLLDTIAHDIRGPLTNIILSVTLLKKTGNEDPKEYVSVLEMIQTSVRKMTTVITELTNSRHADKSRGEKLHIENILEDVRLTISEIIRESHATIKTEFHITEINFSRTKLRSILYNLIGNAIKYRAADRKPEILIKTEKEKGFVVITVKDNGIGLEAGKKEAIFDKYYRVNNKIEGTGIGLYLVKEIVSGAEGRIDVESKLGEGSEFKIYLPE